MLKFVDSRTQGAPPPSHQSYQNRPIPSMQLMSTVSPFVGKQGFNVTAPAALHQNDDILDIFNDDAMVIKSSRNETYRPPSSAMKNLLAPQTDDDVVDTSFQTRRKIDSRASRVDPHLIGGIQTENQWKTTTQDFNNAEGGDLRKVNRKKRFDGDNDHISPITGEAIADYGSWRQDNKDKQQYIKSQQDIINQQQAIKNGPNEQIRAIMLKLKKQLSSFGANGIIGLGRKFRILDDDGSKSLSLSEFKKGMDECKMTLTPVELQELFKYFDIRRTGNISYDDFIETIAGDLNPNRKKFVDMAFDILDKDGNGCIEPADIAETYNASKHPEVISGKKTPQAVLREFLDGFDVGGEVDGKVTKQEFENYYKKISSSIDNDNYFELMMRNAWHISGGEGQAANSSNRRVLVTRADGSQAVQEITNDLGLRADDKAGMISRLKAQGVDARNVDLYGGYQENDKKASTSTNMSKKPISSNYSSSAKKIGNSNKNDDMMMPSSGDHSAPPPAPTSSSAPAMRGRQGNALKPNQPPVQAPSAIDAGLTFLINRVKESIKSRGAHGFLGLQRAFKIMDDDGSKSLSLLEFKQAMKALKVDINELELRKLFEFFDRDHSGTIDFEEFIQGVRDPISSKRLVFVCQAYDILDEDGSGIVDANEIASKYDCNKHPDVLAKKKTPQAVLNEFLKTFEVGGEVDGKVTRQEFINYYTNIGASIDNDNYFELMMRNAWHISGGEGQAANSSNRRVLVTKADGSQAVQEITNDLGLRADDKAGMISLLKAQGVDARNVDLYGGMNDTDGQDKNKKFMTYPYRPKKSSNQVIDNNDMLYDIQPGSGLENLPEDKYSIQQYQRPVNSAATMTRPRNTLSTVVEQGQVRPKSQPLFPNKTSIAPKTLDQTISSKNNNQSYALSYDKPVQVHPIAKQIGPSNPPLQTPSAGLQFLLERVKASLKSRGGNGFINLQRLFHIMDDDGSKSLNITEFRKSMKDFNIGMTDPEIRLVFDYFDTDKSSEIDFEEFIQGIRDPLSSNRLLLVDTAFTLLDVDDNGCVDADEIASKYDPSKHPEVLAGRKTPKAVLTEFLRTFDVGGEVDGKVTRQEFINYYTNIGASIDNDNYFELMMRNAWHISGGQGQAANSSNRRVLVTRADGSQAVQEITNDLGLRADDKAGMISRLKAQGVDARNVDLYGGYQENDSLSRDTNDKEGEKLRALEEQVKDTKTDAATAFSQGNYYIAEKKLLEVEQYLLQYIPAKHPSVLKVSKSIQLVRSKAQSNSNIQAQSRR